MASDRRAVVVSVLLAAAALTLAFTTGAAVVGDSTDTLADERLVVQPAAGPNGAYARVTDTNEIAVDLSAANPKLPADFEGVDPHALAAIDGVFTITYTADEYARVWIDHPGTNITFVANGRSIEGRANTVTLSPNETLTVGLRVDTRGTAAGTQLGSDAFDIRATVADPADVDTTADDEPDDDSGAITTVRRPTARSREFVASELPAGEAARFETDGLALSGYATLDRAIVTSASTGEVAFSIVGSPDPVAGVGPLTDAHGARPEAYFTVNRSFTSEPVATLEFGFSVDRTYLNNTGAAPTDVVLYGRADTADGGWERLETERVDPAVRRLLNLPSDRVHYRATTTDISAFVVATDRPVLRASRLSLTQATVEPGAPVVVRTTVTNVGRSGGRQNVTLTRNGTAVATRSVTLEPAASTTLTFETRVNAPGTYSLGVGERTATLVVRDASDANTTESVTETDTSAPDTLTEEPSGITLRNLVGLVGLLLLLLVSTAVSRRVVD